MTDTLAPLTLPTLKSAFSVRGGAILTTWEQRDVRAKTKTLTTRTYAVRRDGDCTALDELTPFAATLDAKLVSVSPSGARMVLVRHAAETSIVETWLGGVLSHSVEIARHVYCDAWLGGVAWLKAEDVLLIIAERSSPTEAECTETTAKSFAYDRDWGELYDGRRHPTPCLLHLATGKLVEIASEQLASASLSCGDPLVVEHAQSSLGREGEAAAMEPHCICVGWREVPTKLGLVYCEQRPSALYQIPLGAALVEVRGGEGSTMWHEGSVVRMTMGAVARSPRLSADGSTLVYLAADVGSTHGLCSSLCTIDLTSARRIAGSSRIVVCETVYAVSSSDDFPGLYLGSLPQSCFTTLPNGALAVVCSSQWCSDLVAIAIQVGDRDRDDVMPIVRLTPPKCGSDRVLTVTKAGDVIVESSTPACSSVLAVFGARDIATGTGRKALRARRFGEQQESLAAADDSAAAAGGGGGAPSLPKTLRTKIESKLWWQTLRIATGDEGECVEVILTGSRSAAATAASGEEEEEPRLSPLVVYPHGGPHSAWSTTFHARSVMMALDGYVVAKVNYRGSTGFGFKTLQSLVGRVGDSDVEDVLLALDTLLAGGIVVLDMPPIKLDPTRVAYVGGSHGGFIGAHLVARRPDAFQCAVLRNPVCNIASMVGVTDIPDWCFVEAGLPYDFTAVQTPTPEQLGTMWRASPLQHVAAVTAPILVCIGAKDRRVPPSNGLEWFRSLRFHQAQATGASSPTPSPNLNTSRLLWYPHDSHPLSSVECETHMWPEVLSFLRLHMEIKIK